MDKIYVEYRFSSGWVVSGIVERDEARGVMRMANNLNEPAPPFSAGTHVSIVLQDQLLLEAKVSGPDDAPEFHRRSQP